jgi:hypothetical protein
VTLAGTSLAVFPGATETQVLAPLPPNLAPGTCVVNRATPWWACFVADHA